MRTYTRIRVLDRWNAWEVAEQRWPSALLATVDDYADAVLPRWQPVRRHVEVFSDLVDPTHDLAPSVEQVERIIGFARSLAPADRLLLHCAAGIGRSAASALIVQAAQGRDPAMSLRSLLRIRPQADPNPLLLLYADEVLHDRRPTLLAVWHVWASTGGRRVPPSTREALDATPAWSRDRWVYEIGGRADPPADMHRSSPGGTCHGPARTRSPRRPRS